MGDWRPRVEAMIAGQQAAPPPAPPPEVDDWITPAEPMAAAAPAMPEVDDWITPEEPSAPSFMESVNAAPGRVLESAIRGGVEGFKQGGIVNLSREEQARAVQEWGPIAYPIATLGAGVDLAARAGAGLFRGAQAGVQQIFDEFGNPRLGRDAAASMEAFAGSPANAMRPRAAPIARGADGAGPRRLTGPDSPMPSGPAPGSPPGSPGAPRPAGPLPTTWGEVLQQTNEGTPPPAAPRPVAPAPPAPAAPPAAPRPQQQSPVMVAEPVAPPVSPVAALDAIMPAAERRQTYPHVPEMELAVVLDQAVKETMQKAPPGTLGMTPDAFMARVRLVFEGLMLPINTAATIAARKTSLGNMLNDPRPNEEIAAAIAAQQTGAVDDARTRLPEGFTIQEQPGGEWTLVDPAGDPVGSVLDVPTQADLDKWITDAEGLAQDVDWSDALRDGDGTKASPVNVVQPNDIAAAASQAADPTPGQAEAGNYRKGHIKLHGLDIAIETPAGVARHGIDPDGKPWTTVMPAEYGRIKRTKGAEGDQVDVYLGPSAHEANQHPVWIVDQIDPKTGQFDEHKAMIGFPTRQAAETAYRAAFSDGSGQSRIGAVSDMAWPQFTRWARRGNTTDPLLYQPPARTEQPGPAGGPAEGEIIQVPQDPGPAPIETAAPPAAPAPAAEPAPEPIQQLMVEAELLEMELADQGTPGSNDAWDQVQIPVTIEEDAEDPPISQWQRDNIQAVKDLLDKAPLIRAQIKYLHEEGMVAKEIAKVIGWDVDTVRTARDIIGLKPHGPAGGLAFGMMPGEDDGGQDGGSTRIGGDGDNGGKAPADASKPAARPETAAEGAGPKPGGEAGDGGGQRAPVARPRPAGDQGRPTVTTEPDRGPRRDPEPSAPSPSPSVQGPGEQGRPTVKTAEAPGEGVGKPPRTRTAKPGPKAPDPSRWERIGRNLRGKPLFEDEHGVRSFVEDNIRVTESVQIRPDGTVIFNSEDRGRDFTLSDKPEPGIIYPDGSTDLDDVASIAPVAVPKGWRRIGTNFYDNLLFEDERFVRSYMADGSRVIEPFTTDGPNGEVTIGDRSPEFMTVEEVEKAEPKVEGTKVDAPEVSADGAADLADAFRDAFLAGRSFATIQQARAFAAQTTGQRIEPGTMLAKQTDEQIEAGIVAAAREIVDDMRGDPAATYDRLVRLYGQQPNLSTRTSGSIARQAYSTPMPLAFAASELAGISPDTGVVYEPTAGNGALLIGADTASVIANELDPERRAALEAQGMRLVTGRDASKPIPKEYERIAGAVIANPPFGAVKGDDGKTVRYDMDFIQQGYDTGEIDHAIALRSLEVMRDDGRAVLILGGINKLVKTPKGRADAYNGKAKREFFYTLYGKYNVVDHFTVPGDLYAKQGAAWPVDVIVIEGRGKSTLPLPSVKAPRIVPTWDAIKEVMINGRATGPDGGITADDVADAGAPTDGLGGNDQPAGVSGPDIAGGPSAPDDATEIPGAADAEGGVDAGPGVGPGNGAVPAGAGNDAGGASTGGEKPGAGQASGPSGNAAGQPGVSKPTEPGNKPPAPAVERQPDDGSRGDDPGDVGNGLAGPGATKPAAGAGVEPAAPRPQRAAANTEKPQVAYETASKAGRPVGTLVPTNLSSATQGALDALVERVSGKASVKNVDDFVADKLGYSLAELSRYFSGEQIDAIALGIDQIDKGQGFVIGDQTGVGKGRVVAGMIRYAERAGLVPIFVTEKPNLFADMARDLRDIGMPDIVDKILATNGNLRLSLTENPNGPKIKTADTKQHDEELRKVAREVRDTGRLPDKYRVVMTTYNQLQTVRGAKTTRMQMAEALAPQSFLILDEAHNAGGAGASAEEMTTKSGKLILPRSVFFRQLVAAARSTFFSSATWAKRPDVMDLYGAKTGMRAAVENLEQLAETIAQGGVPMQQIVTSQLAQMGQYIRRERSFDGVTYDLVPIEVDKKAYDDIAGILAGIFRISVGFVKPAIKEISDSIREGAKGASGGMGVGDAGASTTSFGSVMHNLINQMLLASKAQGTIDRALVKLKEGKKPVITVANTMGAFIQEFAQENNAENGDLLDLTFNNLLKRYLRRTLRYLEKRPFSSEPAEEHWLEPDDLGAEGAALYHEIEAAIDALSLGNMPVSPIDYMRSKLIAAGYKVGEITGRTEAADYRADGRVYYRIRPGKELTVAGRTETIRGFNRGDLDVIILNQSGATGLSLHASEQFEDKRKRAMLIAQAENNIDTHMQMLGRVHRTGQVIAPEYEQLIADIPAEKRPAAVLAAKMASLNASTTSSRKAMIGAANTPDFINRYGGVVAASVVDGLEDWADVLKDAIPDTEEQPDYESIARKITGRIPLLPLARQEEVYGQIEDQYLKLIEELDAAGENALEAKTLDLDAKVVRSQEFIAGKGDPSNPFSAPAMLDLMDVKRTTKPPKPEFVVLDVARAMKVPGATVERYQDLSFDDMATALSDISTDSGQDVIEDLLQKLDARIAADQKKIRGMKDEDAAKKRQERTLATQQRISGFLRVAVPGTIITIQSGDEDVPMRAVVIDVELKGKSPSASAPSNYELTVMAEDGIRRRIEGARLYTADTMPQSAKEQNQRVIAPVEDQHAAAEFLASLSDQSKRAREERWIITGNILAGYAERSGQIVNFTDDKGAIKQGVLLSRDFDPAKNMAGKVAVFTVDQAYHFLTTAMLDLPTIEGSVKGIRIARDSRGRFVISAPSAKATGGVYYLDRNLLRSIGDDFVRSGQDMRATISADRLRPVLGEIHAILRRENDRFISRHPQAAGWLEAADKPMLSAGQAPEQARASSGWESIENDPIAPTDPVVIQASIEAVQKIVGPKGRVQTIPRTMTAQAGMSTNAGADIGGFAMGGLMRVAEAPRAERFHWTLHHESIHVLRNLGLFSAGEWKTLEAAARRQGWVERFDVAKRYPNLSEDRQIEEAIAEAFASASRGDKDAPTGGVLGRAWQKTQRFLGAFRNALEGRGLRTAEGVFERTTAGRVGSRSKARMEPRGPQDTAEQDRRAAELERALTLPTDEGDVSLMAGMSPELRRLLAEAAARTKRATETAVSKLWSGTKVPDGVTVEQPLERRDISSLTAPFKTPTLVFQHTELAPVIAAGIRAEELQSRWITRLVHRYDQIRKTLDDADGSFDKVTEALWAGDADQVDIADAVARAELFDEFDLDDAEAEAFMSFHKLLEAQARLVDNHRRYMMPKVRAEKQRLIDALERILDHARVPGGEAGRLYRRRATLTRRIARGTSRNPAVDSAAIQAINVQLRAMRAQDPDIQARISDIQDNIDALEARLNASGVRGRVKGYVPHKFYGSWRLWVLGEEDPETGEREKTEITSDQGFYNTREEAIDAAVAYKAENPDAEMLIAPKQIQWPVGIEGTTVSDAAFGRLARNLASRVELRGPALDAILTGVARRQNRRRMYGPGLHREGAEGYSREMDRVMRTHIGQTVRYVTMDKLKFQAITAMEKAGIGPYRIVTQERKTLQRAFASWLDDVMGRKQGFEETIDAALRRFPVPATVLMTGLAGTALASVTGIFGAAGAASPLISAAFGGYAGYQMYKTLTGKAVPWQPPEHYTDFPFRQFTSHMTTGMAHLLLGMVINIKSALVNLMQTPVNTYPELGLKYTLRGMNRAAAATWASMRGQSTSDTRLMERAGIQTLYRITEAGPVLAEHESKLAKFSMWAFQSMENINRSVAFFGGYARGIDAGHTPRDAFEQATKVVRDTQFHMGNANKPELLRQQWARMPGQFKNFLFQQIARMLSIPVAKAAKTVAMMAVLGGALALPGFQVMNAGVKLLTNGWSPQGAIEQTVLEWQAVGGWAANTATVFARGLPALYTDISQSVGLGVGALPEAMSDLSGPWWSKVATQQQAAAKNAGLVDRLAALSPGLNPLKALEAAANGMTIGSRGFIDALGDGKSAWTDWRRQGKLLYEPTNLQLLGAAFNFTPPGVTALRSAMRQTAQTIEEYRRDRAAFMADIIQAVRNKDYRRAGEIIAKANGEGHPITRKQVSEALKAANMPAGWRMLEDAPKHLRPQIDQFRRGAEHMMGGPPAR